jgi:hypothetical protein
MRLIPDHTTKQINAPEDSLSGLMVLDICRCSVALLISIGIRMATTVDRRFDRPASSAADDAQEVPKP